MVLKITRKFLLLRKKEQVRYPHGPALVFLQKLTKVSYLKVSEIAVSTAGYTSELAPKESTT